MERNSFTFKKEWRDAICELPEKVRAEVYAAIIEYGITGEAPQLKPMARVAFAFVKAEMDNMANSENNKETQDPKPRRGAPAGNRNAAKLKKDHPQTHAEQQTHADDNLQSPTNPIKPIHPINDQRPTFDAQTSTFNVQRSMFDAQTSTFNVQCSKFNVQSPPPIHREITQIARDRPWVESVCMLFSLKPQQLTIYFSLFRTECEAQGKLCHDSLNDCKRHFTNWLRIQVTKRNNYEQSERQKALRRRTDVPDAQKTDYHSAL